MNRIYPADLRQPEPDAAPRTIVDVRTPPEFRERHAAGAINLPLDALSAESLKAALEPAAAGRPLLLMCLSGARAERAQRLLADAGIEGATVVDGGIDAWEKAGLPVVRGPRRTIGLERQVRIAAGSLVVLGLLTGWQLHPVGFALATFVGCGLIFAGITGWCGMGMLLARAPWNRQ